MLLTRNSISLKPWSGNESSQKWYSKQIVTKRKHERLYLYHTKEMTVNAKLSHGTKEGH